METRLINYFRWDVLYQACWMFDFHLHSHYTCIDIFNRGGPIWFFRADTDTDY